jgi:hypothetical protein
MDKLIDILKWIGDKPFRLVTVIILGLAFGSAFLGWELRGDIRNALRGHPVLKDQKDIEAAAEAFLRDSEAAAIVVHEMDVAANKRITRLALSKNNGRFKPLHGYTTALFNSGQNKRNEATITMLRGEVFCAPFKSSSKAGKFFDGNGVTYACRAGIGPVGMLHGYAAVGFAEKPADLATAKARILIAVQEMCR